MKKNISILGSTGSVGLSTLKIIDKKKDFFRIILLAANNNYKLICEQIKKYKPIIGNHHTVFDSTFHQNKWKKITYQFKATQAFKFLTIGNFEKDEDTNKEIIPTTSFSPNSQFN